MLLLLLLLIFWRRQLNETDEGETTDELERFESMRECVRTILSCTSLHRMSAVLAEAWQLGSALKIYGPSTLAISADPLPIQNCAPNLVPSGLHTVGVQCSSHVDILEEEIASLLALVRDLSAFADSTTAQSKEEVSMWLLDFKFAVEMVQFAVVHRDA